MAVELADVKQVADELGARFAEFTQRTTSVSMQWSLKRPSCQEVLIR